VSGFLVSEEASSIGIAKTFDAALWEKLFFKNQKILGGVTGIGRIAACSFRGLGDQ
jgi:hypothetical protein